jgi:hypothetical protein
VARNHLRRRRSWNRHREPPESTVRKREMPAVAMRYTERARGRILESRPRPRDFTSYLPGHSR